LTPLFFPQAAFDSCTASPADPRVCSAAARSSAKDSFNMDTEHIRGIGNLGIRGLALYYGTEEAMEGRNAFMEKRNPNFDKFRK